MGNSPAVAGGQRRRAPQVGKLRSRGARSRVRAGQGPGGGAGRGERPFRVLPAGWCPRSPPRGTFAAGLASYLRHAGGVSCSDGGDLAEAAERGEAAPDSSGRGFRSSVAGVPNLARASERQPIGSQLCARAWPSSAARPAPPGRTRVGARTRRRAPKGTPGAGGDRGSGALAVERAPRFPRAHSRRAAGSGPQDRGEGWRLKSRRLNLLH